MPQVPGGTLHHIIIRGIERKAIFKENTDRNNFMERLGQIISETDTGCTRILSACKCSDVSKAMGISAVTVSKAVSLGSELSEVDKIQKQMLDN